MRFKIDWPSLIVGRKFTVLALFYFVFEGNFKVQAPPPPPPGVYIWRGNLTNSFLRYEFGGLIYGGAYFPNFTVADEHASENELKADFCRPSTKSPERYFKLGSIE